MRMGVLNTSLAEEIKADALELMRAGIAEAEAEPPADVGLVFEHAYGSPPPSQAEDYRRARRCSVAERFLVEAVNDASASRWSATRP